jgi:hypothetical protein
VISPTPSFPLALDGNYDSERQLTQLSVFSQHCRFLELKSGYQEFENHGVYPGGDLHDPDASIY